MAAQHVKDNEQGSTTRPIIAAREKISDMKDTAKEKGRQAQSRLKQLWHKYGYVAIVTYFGLYFGTLFLIYLAFHFKLTGNFDPQAIVRWLGLEAHFAKFDSKAGEFAMAWLTTKLTEPVRIALTAFLTPKIARLVGRAPPKKLADAVKAAKRTVSSTEKK